MITRTPTGKVLDIFENFRIDRSLPKYKRVEEDTKQSDVIQWNSPSMFVNVNTTGTNSALSTIAWTPGIGQKNDSPKIIQSAINKFVNWIRDLRRESPEKVFAKLIKYQLSLEAGLYSRLGAIENMKARAKENGQTALYEEIVKNEQRLKSEAVLSTAGFKYYLPEELVIEFADKCERGLLLTWMENFTRTIPTEVIEKKILADKLKIFDNYVVLHFDPNGKSTKLTEAEVRKKKDPILFGVFRDSRRVYFIGDWKDEFCDLTFDEVVEKLGKADGKDIVLP